MIYVQNVKRSETMINDFQDLTLEEIENGIRLEDNGNRYVCNICRAAFERGEIFQIGERFFDAEKAARLHVKNEHGGMLEILTSYEKKHTGLTEHQSKLLLMLADGLTDGKIATLTKTSAATVRHQRFTFREKARQAKLYLAVYELAMAGKDKTSTRPDKNEDLIEVHEGAKMVDERYMITKAEEEEIISNMFSSLVPLRLKNLSPKEKKKIVILRKIASQFEPSRKYSEKEINDILRDIYDDFATVRRYLIEYGFMDRTRDCASYWLNDDVPVSCRL